MGIKVPRFKKENGFETDPLRSKTMSRIKGLNSKPEILLRKAMWGKGIRYRKNVKSLPGTPDIVIMKARLVIFVDGEFWHGFRWDEKKKKILQNRDFWLPKIERNMERDRRNEKILLDAGYQVVRFWSKDVLKDLNGCVNKIVSMVPSGLK